MNIHPKESVKTIHRIAPIATALSVMLLAACSVPVQVPIQTKPQGESSSAFVDQLRQSVPVPAKPGVGKSDPLAPAAVPATLPEVVWPARGAGDFETASAAPPIVPEVVWPARGAGDFETAGAVPAIVPEVVWPARGAGDFETAIAAPPIYWYTVGVDERELNPPAAAPASIRAREDLRDRHPSLFESVPAAPQKAGDDAHDRHPSLLGAVAANPKAEVGDFDRLPRLTPIVPVTSPKAGENLSDRHPQLYPGGPRVNSRADDLLIGPESVADRAQTADFEQKDDMWYRDASRNER